MCKSLYRRDRSSFKKKKHLIELRIVLTSFATTGLEVKIAKCSLAQSEVKLLEHVVNGNRVTEDPEKYVQ